MMTNPCEQCIVLSMCINRTYIKCSILTSYLRSIYPSNESLVIEVKTHLQCEILWWSSKNEWLCFHRDKDFSYKPDERLLKSELCQDSYCSGRDIICYYNQFGERS